MKLLYLIFLFLLVSCGNESEEKPQDLSLGSNSQTNQILGNESFKYCNESKRCLEICQYIKLEQTLSDDVSCNSRFTYTRGSVSAHQQRIKDCKADKVEPRERLYSECRYGTKTEVEFLLDRFNFCYINIESGEKTNNTNCSGISGFH